MATDKTILDRAKLVGFSQAALARAAAVHEQTVSALSQARSRGPVAASLQKIEAVVVAREIETLDRLLDLHFDVMMPKVEMLLQRRGFAVSRSERHAA
jgi:transcriptional regulator with XRE-family HTH domain